jgi:hypothetical protein
MPSLKLRPKQAKYVIKLRNFLKTAPGKPPHPLIPGAEFVGCGYDVFGEYASPGAVIGEIFDFTKAKAFTTHAYKSGAAAWSVPSPMVVRKMDPTRSYSRKGETIQEYSRDLSRSVDLEGGFLGFGAEVEAKYSATERFKTESYFTDVRFNHSLYSLRLDVSTTEAQALLTPQFKTELESGDPKKLFSKYGTHILAGVVMGGALRQWSSTDRSSYNSNVSIDAAAQARVDMLVWDAGGSLSVQMKEAVHKFEQLSTFQVEARGGDPTLRAGAWQSQARWDEWIGSIPADASFVDFTNPTTWAPLVPVWKLSKSSRRQQELENAYTKYAREISAKTDLIGPVVAKLQVIRDSKNGEISPPRGFTKLSPDLNKGAGGDFIFLCVQKLTRARLSQAGLAPITDLAVIYGKHASPPAGFEKIGVDLNKGAGGHYIYLCYKRGNPDEAIREIRVIHGNDASIEPPIPFKKLPQDLNKGSGGAWIFVCFARV